MKRYGALLLLAAMAVGCGGSSSPKPAAQLTISGDVRVHDIAQFLHGCKPFYRSASDTMAPGVTVTVYNAAGTVVATTTLGSVATDAGTNFGSDSCDYLYTASVPPSAFYQVQVGSESKITFPRSKVGAADISVTYS